jgi:hypothetical protein
MAPHQGTIVLDGHTNVKNVKNVHNNENEKVKFRIEITGKFKDPLTSQYLFSTKKPNYLT